MKKWILVVYCLSAGLLTCAMEPVGFPAEAGKENESYYFDLEDIESRDLSDFPNLSPIKNTPALYTPYHAHAERSDDFDLDALLASPKNSPSEPPRIPLPPLDNSALPKRVLFPDNSSGHSTSEIQSAIESKAEKTEAKKAKMSPDTGAKKRNHDCHLCDKKFKHKTDLTHHLSSHLKIKPFTCPHCDKSFVQKSQRKTHVERVHMGIQIPCDEVVIQYAPGSWPQEKYPYQCKACNKGFVSNKYLLVHRTKMSQNLTHQKLEEMVILADNSVSPNFSTEHFAHDSQEADELTAQQTLGTVARQKEKAPLVIPCSLCGQSFSTMIQYVNHKMNEKCGHSGETNVDRRKKPFNCEYCPQSFTLNSNRRKHIRNFHQDQLKQQGHTKSPTEERTVGSNLTSTKL